MAWVVCCQLDFPVVDTMQWQWVTHDSRDSTVVGALAYFIPCDLDCLTFLLNSKVEVFMIENCPYATVSKTWLSKLVRSKYTSGDLELQRFKN